MPEIFENGGFTLKMHQIFSVHTKLNKFENATITRARKSRDHRDVIVFEKLRFQISPV